MDPNFPPCPDEQIPSREIPRKLHDLIRHCVYVAGALVPAQELTPQGDIVACTPPRGSASATSRIECIPQNVVPSPAGAHAASPSAPPILVFSLLEISMLLL